MSLHIDHLSEEELIDLNRRIVERLRTLRDAKAQRVMIAFKLGERVEFTGPLGETVTGMLTRHNKKTVTVIADDGHRWNVAPGFLRAAPSLHVNAEGKIVESARPKK